MKQKSKYVFAGSFDPFTIGHRDIVDRALQMCDEVIIAIGIHPEKRGMFSIEERKAQIQAVYADEPRVTVSTYEGLTVDFARSIGATALLRSIRTVKDMEYERDLADMNRRISVCEQYPQGIDTVFLFCRPEHTSVSSTVVRQLIQLGKDVSAFLPMLLFVVCSLVSLNLSAQSLDIDRTQMQKLQAAEFFISHFYVDSLSDEKTVDAAIDGMLKQLDPHSTYIKAKDVERSTENLNGSFEGIGVQFNMVEDTLVVIQPVSGGPSEKKGVLAGDRIVTVNDTAIAGVKMSREEIMRRLRGPKDSKVRIGIVRNGVKGVNEFTIVRDKIPVHTLDASYMVDDSIGYIRLSSFGQTTLEEFMSAYNTLRTQGMRRLLLDLQGNGGGYLSAAVELANEFLPDGSLIVYTEGRLGRVAEELKLDDISTGASNDLERATNIARQMITKYGFSEKLGPVSFSSNDEVFLGRDFSTRQNYSEEVASEVDHEIRRLLEECYAETRRILQENDEAFERVAQALLRVETIDGEQFERLFKGEVTPEELQAEVESENREIERKNKLEAAESERLEAERRREIEEQRRLEQEALIETAEDLGRPKDIMDWSEEPEDKFGYEEYKRATDRRRKEKVQPRKLTEEKKQTPEVQVEEIKPAEAETEAPAPAVEVTVEETAPAEPAPEKAAEAEAKPAPKKRKSPAKKKPAESAEDAGKEKADEAAPKTTRKRTSKKSKAEEEPAQTDDAAKTEEKDKN